MGMSITPQGIMVALIAVAAVALIWVNRQWVFKLASAVAKTKAIDAAGLPAAEPDEPEDINVLDILKTLSAVNEDQSLGINTQLKEIYAILTEGWHDTPAADIFDAMKLLTQLAAENGIDCQEELRLIYGKIVTHKPTVETP